MAEVQTQTQASPTHHEGMRMKLPDRSTTITIPPNSNVMSVAESQAARLRNRMALDAFSPVNQNGSFEFDRVLKSGYVQKRTQKTKVGFSPLSRTLRIPRALRSQ